MSLLQFSNFAGNLKNDYLIGGNSGIMLRKVSGGFEVRSSDGSALATLEASYVKSSNAPTANDHLTNKLYVDGIESTAISTAASTAASLDTVVLSTANSTAASLDAIVQSTAISTATSLDAIVQSTAISTAASTAASLDVVVLSTATSTAESLDVVVLSSATSTAASLDTIVLSTANSTAASLDAIVESTAISTATSLDAVVLSSANSTAASLDVVVQSTAISTAASTAASLDAVVLSTATSTANSLDVIVLSSANSTAASLDAIVQSTAISTAVSTAESLDVIVLSSATSTAESLDVVVLSSANSTAASLDVVVLSSANSTAASLDAIVQSTAISTAASTAASLDAVVLSSATSTANSLDTIVLSTANSTAASLDAVVLSSATSTANSLDAIVLSTANAYTDSVAQGLNIHTSVRLATADNTPLPSCTPSGSGVGKTLTGDANGALLVDGIAVALNNRILVKDQLDAKDNGIYVVTAIGDISNPFVLTRATDFDGSPAAEVASGDFFFVEEGNTELNEGYVLITPNPITVDVSNLVFAQFSGAGQITAGNGLSKSGNTLALDLNNITTTITSAEDSDMIAIADASDSLLTKKISKANLLSGIATANGLAKRIEVPVTLSNASSTTAIPVGARVEAVTVIIETAYATSAATLEVSIDGSTPLVVAATTDSDTQFAAVYKSEPYSKVGVNNNGVVKVTVGGSPSGAGAATVIVQYCEATLA